MKNFFTHFSEKFLIRHFLVTEKSLIASSKKLFRSLKFSSRRAPKNSAIPRKHKIEITFQKKFDYKKKLDKFFSNCGTLIEATKALSYFNHEKTNYGNSKKSNSKEKTGS